MGFRHKFEFGLAWRTILLVAAMWLPFAVSMRRYLPNGHCSIGGPPSAGLSSGTPPPVRFSPSIV